MDGRNTSPSVAKKPLFSCVLPTKNRVHLLRTCVASILNQTFEDFELIVVDNDDTEETGQFLETIKDRRLLRVRTGGFSMPENWQKALRCGKGEYLIVVEDKMHFRKNALELIADAIYKTKNPLVTWKFDQIPTLDVLGDLYLAKTGEVQTISSREVLSSAERGEWRLLGWAGPRGLNSAISRAALDAFESKWSVSASRRISPDYTIAYSMLMSYASVVHIDSILAGVLANSLSVGGACLVRGPLMREFLRELGMTEEECTSFVPVRYHSPVNSIYNDLLSTASMLKVECNINVPSYFKSLAEEVYVGEDMGGDLSSNRSHLSDVFWSQCVEVKLMALKYILEQICIKSRNGYPWKKAVFRAFHQMRNLGLLPI